MIGEIWTYIAVKLSDNKMKTRPVLVIGSDANNQLQYVDIHYVIISSSANCGIYDIEIEEEAAKKIGLNGRSVIKTTKIYTGTKSQLGTKIADLPSDIKKEFYRISRKYYKAV